MTGQRDPALCHYVRRDASWCEAPSVVVLDSPPGNTPVGACPDHVWQVLRWWQDGEMNGPRFAEGQRVVQAWPASLYLREHQD